jgi:hypothetical protein
MATRSEKLNERADKLAAKGNQAKASLLQMKAQYGAGGERAMLQSRSRQMANQFSEDPSQSGLTKQQTQDQIAAATQGAAAAAQQQQAALAQQALAAPGGFQAGYLTSASQGLGKGTAEAAMGAAGQAAAQSQQMIAQREAQVSQELERALQRKREAQQQAFDTVNQTISTAGNVASAASGVGGAAGALSAGGIG